MTDVGARVAAVTGDDLVVGLATDAAPKDRFAAAGPGWCC
jgi:hypothetical protein